MDVTWLTLAPQDVIIAGVALCAAGTLIALALMRGTDDGDEEGGGEDDPAGTGRQGGDCGGIGQLEQVATEGNARAGAEPGHGEKAVLTGPKFEIYRAPDGWRWRLVARNGRIVADSGEAYVRRSNVVTAARRVAKQAGAAIIVDD